MDKFALWMAVLLFGYLIVVAVTSIIFLKPKFIRRFKPVHFIKRISLTIWIEFQTFCITISDPIKLFLLQNARYALLVVGILLLPFQLFRNETKPNSSLNILTSQALTNTQWKMMGGNSIYCNYLSKTWAIRTRRISPRRRREEDDGMPCQNLLS